MTKRLNTTEIAEAAAFIKQGQLVAFPTETVYGLGADATNPTAVKQVYQAKGRPSDNPLIVHVCSFEQVQQYAILPSAAVSELVAKFWPGPLTIILPIRNGALDPCVTGGLKTAAFRMPDNAATLALIKAAGVPIVGPSANTSGKPSPTTADHVLHDLGGKIAAVLDDGPTTVGVESTVIDLSVVPAVILRPGAVTRQALLTVLPEVLDNQHHVAKDEIPKAPGMKYRHYAPEAAVIIVKQAADFPKAIKWALAQDVAVGLLATDTVLTAQSEIRFKSQFSLGNSVTTASRHLFDGLRYFDLQPEIKIILAEGFEATGLGTAYMNRLEKAAGAHYFERENQEN
ncbi:L-threonylcarbamoyladenylate synthase [Agrilactobacillus yilanensis]|uniref:Threonylcarbamoyl-AMP synthase n=1 Tax=Agrilactobacillus yilanensis TaxID=2485997 RepID=A0ABW4J6F9_9LACO|nr:L-threonylcarbamoyladenylate synthase [Agrilactobacillus yilanensis]